MTLREVFQRLPKDGWSLHRARYIRRTEIGDCPVCAVNGNRAFVLNWRAAAEQMLMPRLLAKRIVDAADGHVHTPTLRRIRRLLMKHCGLEETHEPQ